VGADLEALLVEFRNARAVALFESCATFAFFSVLFNAYLLLIIALITSTSVE
jgi:hypothetical protein